MMAFTGTFNRKASGGANTDNAEAAHEPEKNFNPFAPNVTLSAADAAKLAALEEGHGTGLVRRIRPGDETGTGNRDGKRRNADGPDTAMLEALVMTPQQWDAQNVTVGGVSMTNAQAQAARKRILDNPEYYTDWAKARGLIEEGEEQAFIDTARRITDLKDAERSGKLGSVQKQELENLQDSRLGRAVDQATGQAHREKRYGPPATADQTTDAGEGTTSPAQEDALLEAMTGEKPQQPPERPDLSSVDDPVFASAPSLKSGFAAGLKATEPLDGARTDTAPDDTPPRGPDRTAAASGLDL